jgi:hypothetical protein
MHSDHAVGCMKKMPLISQKQEMKGGMSIGLLEDDESWRAEYPLGILTG